MQGQKKNFKLEKQGGKGDGENKKLVLMNWDVESDAH